MRMDLRWGGVDINRIRALAQELVGLQPDIIVTNSTPPTIAVQRETRTIPIVFASVTDPVAGRTVNSSRDSNTQTSFSPTPVPAGRSGIALWMSRILKASPGLSVGEIAHSPA